MAKHLKKSMCLYNVVESAKNPLRGCHPFATVLYIHTVNLH